MAGSYRRRKTLRVITWNVNGLRAALRKGFHDHIAELKPDLVMLQEIRVTPEQLGPEAARPEGWKVIWHPAEKLGYAGVSTWSRWRQEELARGLKRPDPEGRVLISRTAGLKLVNVYLPSGSRSEAAQLRKEGWMDRFLEYARELARSPEPTLLAGDLNIAHRADDIHNPSGNRRNSGFLPHERAWFSKLLSSGWSDLLRSHVGPMKGPYSWWSNRGNARALNRGWRIDYVLANRACAPALQKAWVHRAGGLTVSDHAPVCITLDRRLLPGA